MNKFILSLLLIPILLVGICAVSASSDDGGAEIPVVEQSVDGLSDFNDVKHPIDPIRPDPLQTSQKELTSIPPDFRPDPLQTSQKELTSIPEPMLNSLPDIEIL